MSLSKAQRARRERVLLDFRRTHPLLAEFARRMQLDMDRLARATKGLAVELGPHIERFRSEMMQLPARAAQEYQRRKRDSAQ